MLRRSNTSSAPIRKYQLLANLALVTVSLCLSLIVAELVLRAIIPPDPRRPFEFRIPHPVLGWALKPDASYLYEMPEGTMSVTYSTQGWRDLEHAVKKPDGVFRILVLGDSFMEANSVELNDAFHRRVEELARAAGSNTEVINMGVAGYGTLQEYLVYRDIGQLYEPDLVLLGFYLGNDLANNSPELASSLTAEGAVTNTRPFLDPTEPTRWTVTPVDFERAQRSYAENMASLEANRNKLTEKLILLRLASAGIKRIPVPEFLKGWGSNPEPIDREAQELALMGVNYCVEPAEFARAWDTTERILARLKEDVDAHGSQLVVFTVPALEEVSVDRMKAVTADVAYPDKLCLDEAPGYRRLSLMLTKLDIEQISLLPDFRRVMREDGINLYQSDLHWNQAGHALAAERVVSELIQKGLLPHSDGQNLLSP